MGTLTNTAVLYYNHIHHQNISIQAFLVEALCPSQEDEALWEAKLPEFWSMIAAVLWPSYWDPTVSISAKDKPLVLWLIFLFLKFTEIYNDN